MAEILLHKVSFVSSAISMIDSENTYQALLHLLSSNVHLVLLVTTLQMKLALSS